MRELSEKNMAEITPLFKDIKETLILSCLQGCMGEAQAEEASPPRAARIVIGDFYFFAGDAFLPVARELVGSLRPGHIHKQVLMVPQNGDWAKLIEESFPGGATAVLRYAFHKDRNVFEQAKLLRLTEALPKEFQMLPIDERIYKLTQCEEWSVDFCSAFLSPEDYMRRGLGFALLREGELVGGASSYASVILGTQTAFRWAAVRPPLFAC